jgi:hypothetical protein
MNEFDIHALSRIQEDYAAHILAPAYKHLQYWKATEATGRSAPVSRSHEAVPSRRQAYVPQVSPYREVRQRPRTRAHVRAPHEYPRGHAPQSASLHPVQGRARHSTVQYPQTLEKAAEVTNRELAQHNAPARYCAFEQDGRLYVDVAFLDENGKVKEDKIYPLSDNNVTYWLERFRSATGLLVNAQG